jgi:hypothetical protein
MQWLWVHDGEKMMKEYEALPEELKGHEFRTA